MCVWLVFWGCALCALLLNTYNTQTLCLFHMPSSYLIVRCPFAIPADRAQGHHHGPGALCSERHCQRREQQRTQGIRVAEAAPGGCPCCTCRPCTGT